MTIDACAKLVETGDPDRFLAALTAPPEMRGRLMVLYAFNLEIARAPWVTNEPMIADIRLQWWLDVLNEIEAGQPARAHEVAGPLTDLVKVANLDVQDLRVLISARNFDVNKDPHASLKAFDAYVDATSGGLMWQACRALGADRDRAAPVRAFGFGAGVANLFQAHSVLTQSGRTPLFDVTPSGISELAKRAQASLKHARSQRTLLPKSCGAALRAGWQADRTLALAATSPERVLTGDLQGSEFRRRTTLLAHNALGRW